MTLGTLVKEATRAEFELMRERVRAASEARYQCDATGVTCLRNASTLVQLRPMGHTGHGVPLRLCAAHALRALDYAERTGMGAKVGEL